MIGPDLDVVGAVAVVELCVARGQATVAFVRARVPPAADFTRLARIAQIDNDVELIVERVGRLEVSRAGGYVCELAIHEPDAMGAARIGSGGVEEGEAQVLEATGLLDASEI